MGWIKNMRSGMKAAKEKAAQLRKYESLTDAQLSRLSDEELETALRLTIEYKIGQAKGDEALDRLKFYEQTYYVLDSFDKEIKKGGLRQFYADSSPEAAAYAADALTVVGAKKTRRLYERFNRENGIDVNNLKKFRSSESSTGSQKQTGENDDVFQAFDDAAAALVEVEPVRAMTLAYVRKELLR